MNDASGKIIEIGSRGLLLQPRSIDDKSSGYTICTSGDAITAAAGDNIAIDGNNKFVLIAPWKINVIGFAKVKKRNKQLKTLGLGAKFNFDGLSYGLVKAFFISPNMLQKESEAFIEQMIENNYVVDGFKAIQLKTLSTVWISQNHVNFYLNHKAQKKDS